MSRMPRGQRYVVVPGRRRRRRVHHRFRALLFLGVPLTLLILIWLLRGVTPSVSFDEVAEALNVQNKERYARLATFGLALVAAAVLVRIWRRK